MLDDKENGIIKISICFQEGDLTEVAIVANFATVQYEADRKVTRNIICYNLDVIISIGYEFKRIVLHYITNQFFYKEFPYDKSVNGLPRQYL